MATIFCTPVNLSGTTVNATYTAGSGTMTVVNGAVLGAPTAAAPVRVTTSHNGVVKSILKVTNVTGNVLTIAGAIDGTTDTSLVVGDVVEERIAAGAFSDIHTAINAIENAVVIASASNTVTLAASADAIVLALKAYSSQVADIFSIQNSGGTPLTGFDASGYGFMRPVTFALALGTPAVVAANLTNQVTALRNGKIIKAYANAKTGPTGAALIFDIKKNGTSIWNVTQANRLQIAAAATTGTQTAFDTTSVSEADLFTVDIAQVGSTVAGQDITVTLLILCRNK